LPPRPAHDPSAACRRDRRIATLIADQASKLWLVFVFDLARRGVVRVTPFFDLVLTLNHGIPLAGSRASPMAQILLMG